MSTEQELDAQKAKVREDWKAFDDQRKLNEVAGRNHSHKKADCQLYSNGTRRRNPYPGEDNANPMVAAITKAAETANLAKDD